MKKVNRAILATLVISLIMLAGCAEKSNVMEKNIIDIKSGTDDGEVFLFRDSHSNNTGMVMSGGDVPTVVGLFISSSKENITGRAIYRFNLSEWKGGNLTFHVKCVQKYGNPGEVEVYISKDKGPLPSNMPEMKNISYLWNLSDGELVSSSYPKENEWMTVTIPSDKINAVMNSDYITLIIKLKNENIKSNRDYYVFSTSEYNHGSSKPYLSEN